MKRAVIYLRVSSAGQVNKDHDREGFSIPSQRRECAQKAESLGAVVVDEYVDRGESAKTADRQELQRMLARLETERDIDFVIVHKVDRLARNRVDDAQIMVAIQASGAELVSVSEAIDATPQGSLVHGIFASVAEFYSKNLAREVVRGSTEKVRKGGHVGQAPLGYLNIRELTADGHEIRTIGVDEERAPLLKWAFELYATGNYSLIELATLLDAKGLTTRPHRSKIAAPLNTSSLNRILKNEFYVGMVKYRGKQYPGRHEHLISREVFDEVQSVLAAHKLSGERDHKHSHYLKGSLFCGECGGRLTFSRNTGRGGTYDYMKCVPGQMGDCSQRYHRLERLEEAVEDHYATIRLSEAQREAIRNRIRSHLDKLAQISGAEQNRCAAIATELEGLPRVQLTLRV